MTNHQRTHQGTTMQHTHALKPVRSIMMTDRRYARSIIYIKNALEACGHRVDHLRGPLSVRQHLGALPKPELERVLAHLIQLTKD